MELKLQLSYRALLAALHFIYNVEAETQILICFGILATPLLLCSFWKVGITLLLELFVIGVNMGCAVLVACVAMEICFWKPRRGRSGHGTFQDKLLSIAYQTGLSFPVRIWDCFDKHLYNYMAMKVTRRAAKKKRSTQNKVRFADPVCTQRLIYDPPSPDENEGLNEDEFFDNGPRFSPRLRHKTTYQANDNCNKSPKIEKENTVTVNHTPNGPNLLESPKSISTPEPEDIPERRSKTKVRRRALSYI